jgi:hypothetical protein
LRKTALGVLMGVLALSFAAIAMGATVKEHKVVAKFSTANPATSAGLEFVTDRVGFKQPPQGGQVNRVTKIVLTLPRGTRIDNTVPGSYCTPAILNSQGAKGCKKAQLDTSRAGDGEATAYTGIPALDPVEENIDVFNARRGLLIYLTPKPGRVGQTAIITSTIRGNKITITVPRFCLPGDNAGTPQCDNGEATLTKAAIETRRKSKGRGLRKKDLIRTGPCPRSRKFRTRVAYTYLNGDTESQTYSQTCRQARG